MSLLIGGTLAYLFLPPRWALLVVLGLIGLEVFEVMLWLRWRKRRSITGIESMLGERGILVPGARDGYGRARVRIRGTSYPARVKGEGTEEVIVEGVEGMTLVVRRAASS